MSRSESQCPTLYPPSHFATAFTCISTMDHSEPLLLTLDSHSIHHQSHSFITSHHHHHHHHHQYTSQYSHGSPPVSEEAASCSSTSPNALYIHTSPEYATYGIGPTSAQHSSYWDVNAWDASGVSYAGEPSDQASSSLYSHHFSPYATSPPLHSENNTSVNQDHLSQYHHHHHQHQLDLSRSQSIHHSLHHERPLVHQESHLVPHQQLIHPLEYVEYNCEVEAGGGVGGGGSAKYAGSSVGQHSFRNLTSHEGVVSNNNSNNNNNNSSISTNSCNLPGVPGRSASNVTGSGSNRVGRGNKLAPVNPSKKERRRTLSINCAFSNLRECIPNVPVDTKLSKIKTLRLATSYIAYLMNLLNDSDNSENGSVLKGKEGFKVDLQRFKRSSRSASAAAIAAAVAASLSSTSSSSSSSSSASSSSSCVPLTSSTYRNQSSKMAARGGNNLNLNTGTGTGNNCTTRKGAFHLPSTMVTGSLCGSEAPGAGSSLTSPSIMYSSSSANCNSKGTSANATGGAKGRTGWPEHVWELELKNGTGDPNVGTLVACGVATSCINSSGGSDESGILSNIG